MTKKQNKQLRRRKFIQTTGTLTALGLAGCTSTEQNGNNTSPNQNQTENTNDNQTQQENGEQQKEKDEWNAVEEFLQHYKENEIPGEHTNLADAVDGRISLGTVEAQYDEEDPIHSKAREIIPRYAKHVYFPQDESYLEDGMNFVDAARHGIHNIAGFNPEEVFILERDAIGNATLGEAFLNTGTEDQPEWEKDIFLSAPQDPNDVTEFHLIYGEVDKDSTENMVSGRRNLKGMYNPSTSNNISALDWRVLEPESEISEEAWKNFDDLNDTYLPAGIDEVGFTRNALELIAEQEDFYREGGHSETVEAIMEATGFYLNEVEEDNYMALDVENGELTPVEIDEETKEGLIYDPDYPING